MTRFEDANGKSGRDEGSDNNSNTIVRAIGLSALAFLGLFATAFLVLARRRRKRNNSERDIGTDFVVGVPRSGKSDASYEDLESGDSIQEGSPTESSSLFNLVLGEGESPIRTSSQMGEYGEQIGAEVQFHPQAPIASSSSSDSSTEISDPPLVPLSSHSLPSPASPESPIAVAADAKSNKFRRLERELNALSSLIQSHPPNSPERKILSSNYKIARAELDNTLMIQGTTTTTGAVVDDVYNDDSESTHSRSSNGRISTHDKGMTTSSGSYSSHDSIKETSTHSRSTHGSASTHDEGMAPSSGSYSSHKSYVSSTSSEGTLPPPEENSNLDSLVKDALENSATGREGASSDLDNDKNKVPPSKSFSRENLSAPSNEADIEKIRDLEAELQALSLSIQLYRKESEKWLQLNSYMERAQRELDEIRQRIDNAVDAKGVASDNNLDNEENKVPPPRSFSAWRGLATEEELSFTYSSSSENTSSLPRPQQQQQQKQTIQDLEVELRALSLSIQLYRKNSKQWLQLNSFMERAQKELDAIRQGNSRSLQIMAPPGNLGLVLDKFPGEEGPVYVRSLHPFSPLINRVQLKDKIIAIDGEDVQQFSPREVGKLLSRNRMSAQRRITVLRENNDVLASQRSNRVDQSSLASSSVSSNEKQSNRSKSLPPPSTKLEENSQSRQELTCVKSCSNVLAGCDQIHANKLPPSTIVILSEKRLNENDSSVDSPLITKPDENHLSGHLNSAKHISHPPNSAGSKKQHSTRQEPIVISQKNAAQEEIPQPVPGEIVFVRRSETDNSVAVDKFTKPNAGESEAPSLQNSLDTKNDELASVDLTVKTESESAPAPKTASSMQTALLP